MNDTPDSSPADPLRRRRIAGLVLLIIGGLTLLDRSWSIDLGESAPLVLGLIFLVWALGARKCGLLIPGGILTGIGAGLLLRDVYGGNSTFLFCFAGGWVLITLLSLIAFRRWVWWPLIPAGAMAFSGLTQLAGPEFHHWLRAARYYWPVLLIVVALFLLLTKPRPKV
jgi:hypothetical protein